MNNYTLTRRQAREAALIFFYQYLLESKSNDFNVEKFLKKNIYEIGDYLNEKYKTEKNIILVNNELFVLIIKAINQIDEYILIIDSFLEKKWSFNRLNIVEQAILLLSYIQIINGIAKNVVINEAIELAKEYSDDDSYKFINGVLDRIDVK